MTSEQLSAQISRRLAEMASEPELPARDVRPQGRDGTASLPRLGTGQAQAWSQFVAERVGPKGVNVSVRVAVHRQGPMTNPPPA